jgi:hypothetical protein
VVWLALTWTRAAPSTAVRAVAVKRPPEPPHTIVSAVGRATPLAQTVRLPGVDEALTSRTVSTAAVAPVGTPDPLTLRSRVRIAPA